MGKEQAGISKMAGLGTIVNVAGILAGCGVGLLLKGGLPKRLQDTISSAVVIKNATYSLYRQSS